MKTVIGDTNTINMCWHPVTVLLDGDFHHWEKTSKSRCTRVEYSRKEVEPGRFIKKPTRILNLPRACSGIEYIVSEKVLHALKVLHPSRKDFVAPGDQSPDASGKVKYCVGFQV